MQIKADFNEKNAFLDAKFASSNMQVGTKFANYQEVTIHKDVDPYTGAYEVTPKVEAQTVPTAQKFMTEDMKIKAIPFYDVSNTSGGSTVYIGKEI